MKRLAMTVMFTVGVTGLCGEGLVRAGLSDVLSMPSRPSEPFGTHSSAYCGGMNRAGSRDVGAGVRPPPKLRSFAPSGSRQSPVAAPDRHGTTQ